MGDFEDFDGSAILRGLVGNADGAQDVVDSPCLIEFEAGVRNLGIVPRPSLQSRYRSMSVSFCA